MSTALLPRRLLALPLPRSHLAAPSLLLRHASTQSPAARSPAARVAAAQLGTSRRQLGTTSASRAPASTARDVANDAGSTVTGANAHTTQVGQSLSSSAQELKQTPGLKEIGGGIPQGAVVYGAAGLLPYAGTAVGTVWLAREASAAIEGTGGLLEAETAVAGLYYVELLQIQYGAIILSFLGAIHWGLEFASFGGEKGTARYLLGIAPVMAGWTSLLLAPQLALVLQWASFLSMWLADKRATKTGWTPSWYSTYRTYLSTVVMTTIFVSLVGGNYFGPGAERVAKNGGRWKSKVEGAEGSKAVIDGRTSG